MAQGDGEDGRRRPFGSRLLEGKGSGFWHTKAFLLLLACWATAGAVVAAVMIGVFDAGLDDFTSRANVPCTASYMVVAVLIMWALTVSFFREA